MARIFIISAALFLASANLQAHQLPDLGDESRAVISIEDERLIGAMMLRELRAMGLVHPDPIINEYVKYVGNKLTPYMDMPYSNMHIKFFAVRDASINAFAFFDGHMALHTGLITATEHENEIAGVMAHELSHIAQQHLLRQMSESKRLMPVTVAGSLAAVALGVPELIFPAIAGHAQKMINYSRQFEQEADRMGIQILAKANFDPNGLPNMLERMGQTLRYHNKPPEYLLTHPLFESRIADTRSRANSLSFKRQASSNMYYLIKARIKVQSASNLQQLIEEQEHSLDTQRFPNKLGADYGYAYALLQKGEPDKAWQAIHKLVTAYPNDLIIQSTAAEIEVQQNKMQAAQQRMQQLAQLYPDSPAVLLQYTDVLLQNKQPKQAQKVLAQCKNLGYLEPAYYESVRQVEGMLGNQRGVLEANAEWFLLHGDFGSALGQLDSALELKNVDPKSSNRIKNRIAAIQELMQRVKSI